MVGGLSYGLKLWNIYTAFLLLFCLFSFLFVCLFVFNRKYTMFLPLQFAQVFSSLESVVNYIHGIFLQQEMQLINSFETACDDNIYPKKLLYLPYIKLETVFSSAQFTSTFEKSDLYYHGLFWGFIQLPIHSIIIFLLMLLGTGSGLPLLVLLHMFYILQ